MKGDPYPLPKRHPEPNEWRGHSIKLASEKRDLEDENRRLRERVRKMRRLLIGWWCVAGLGWGVAIGSFAAVVF